MKKISVWFLVILLFGVIAVVDLLHPGFAITHDGQDHIARIANFYANLQQGIFIPRWAANLNWGYGHPILEFLYPLPSYIASLFHFLGLSLIDSTKLVFALGMIASGITMFLFVKTVWGEKAGVVSGILYMYAPYKFVDLYVRGDIGDHSAFVFVPLVFLSLYLLSNKHSFLKILFAAVSIACLILAHNAVALMMMPLIILYIVFLWWQQKWKKATIISLIGSFGLGFLLSSFFWVPALLEGPYTLRNIVTKGGYIDRFISLPQLLYGPWSYGQTGMFTVQIGIVQWIFLTAACALAIIFWKKAKRTSLLLGGLLVSTAAAIFLMLPASSFVWSRVMLLQNFQFPWRFLGIIVFTTALICGIVTTYIPKKLQTITTVFVCLLVLFFSRDYMHARAYQQAPESFFTGIYDGTTDTGESAPIWSTRSIGHSFDKPMDVISGKATIIQDKRLTTLHEYTISSMGQSKLLENTLYFPGWKILIDGKPTVIEFQNSLFRGLMTFFVPSGVHTVKVIYSESKLRLLGDFLSLVGMGVVGILFIQRKRLL